MIDIKNLTFCYEGRDENALHDINLRVNSGECIVLCGASGCGKTSITRLINGLIPNFYPGKLEGNIQIDNLDIKHLKPHELTPIVGSVFQNPRTQFFSTDTDSELVFSMENCGFNHEKMTNNYEKTVEALELKSLCNKDIFALSSGEKQRIAFGGIYALNPNVYVLDEPSANLDMKGVSMLSNVIGKLKKQGKTIVIAEHRLYYLKEIADRVIIMKNGRIKQDIRMDSIKEFSDEDLHNMGLRTLDNKKVPLNPFNYISKDSVLNIVNLSASYNKKKIFEGVNLSAKKGDIVGIVGKNGQGKSTLVNIICGVKKEASGRVLFDERYVSPKKRKLKSYLVMQDPNYQLFCDSVYSELKLAMCGKTFSDDDIENVLNKVNLGELKECHPLSLSGGQKQRLSVAIAFLNSAKVILFDEPTSGLDYKNMLNVSAIIKQLSDIGKTILVISHDNEFLLETCNRIIKM